MKTKKILLAAYRSRTPVLLWGPPGVGKTAMLEALAQELGLELIRPHVRAPEDIALPVARPDGGVEIVPVGEFVRAARAGRAVVFLDEITTLPGAVQAAALRFLDSGVVGDLRIPPSVWRVAAANPPELAAGGWDLEAPTANRLTHTVLACDADVHAVGRVTRAERAPLAGGGGTDMGVGLARALTLTPRPQVVVVLTDGYTPWPEVPPPGVRVVVGVVGSGTAPAWATVVRLEEEGS